MTAAIPARLVRTCARDAAGRAWLERLPALIDDAVRRWSIAIGPAFDGPEVSCAFVAPATRANGEAAVLKLGLPHYESRDEAAALRCWNGDGAVRLLDVDNSGNALLLERCDPGTHLRTLADDRQDRVIAGLLKRLWRCEPAATFRPLSALTAMWSDETRTQDAHWPDAGLVREGLQCLHDLAAGAPTRVLLATDLHAGNVLRASREPWLVIDPKPFVGDPAYDATQHLLNGRTRLAADPAGTVSRLADLLELDADRVRLWLFARLAADPRDDWGDGALDLARRFGQTASNSGR